MGQIDESPLISSQEGPVAEVLNPDGAAQIVLVCEHASRFIPARLGDLGLDAIARRSHVAWDIGAFDLARALSAQLDAPLVVSQVSRLVYDCNRPPEARDAIPTRSERYEIPGNANLGPAERAARAAAVYHPFSDLLASVIAAMSPQAALVTVHSFTPVYHGNRRDVELGVLHDADPVMALETLAAAPAHTAMKTRLNAPYSAADGVTHTLRRHAVPRGMANVMLELRNDLIQSDAGVRRTAAELASLLTAVLRARTPVSPAQC